MKIPLKKSGAYLLFAFVFLSGATAFTRIHLRMQTTLIGYDIGRLKEYEASLLKKRSLLAMELAKATSRHQLESLVAAQKAVVKPIEKHRLAVQ